MGSGNTRSALGIPSLSRVGQHEPESESWMHWQQIPWMSIPSVSIVAARVPSLHLQVYSIELVGVMSQACKSQLDIIFSALCPDEHQSNGLESHAQQQRIPCMTEPYQLVRALFILLQNPLNGQLLPAEGCCLAHRPPVLV